MRRVPHASVLALSFLALAGNTSAQTIRGQVVSEATGEPIVAAFLTLRDEAGVQQAAGLTGRNGVYELRAPAPGRYRLSVERIGFENVVTEPLELAAGETREHRIEVRVQAITLEAIAARGEERCRLSREAGHDTQRVWEEARKALAIADWMESAGRIAYQAAIFTRSRDLDSDRVTDIDTHPRQLRSGVGKSPFAAMPAADLAGDGYIRELASGNYQYYGLDAGTLLSDEFLETHCFGVTRGSQGGVGLAFSPLPGQREPDVEGTLWLDEETLELQTVEYNYSRHLLGADVPKAAFGGRADFRRLENGAWITSRWLLRMPQVLEMENPAVSARVSGGNLRTDYQRTAVLPGNGLAVREAGGELKFVAAPGYLNGNSILEGTVYDSTRHRPLAGATVFLTTSHQSVRTDMQGRFRMIGLPAGEHEVAFFHPHTDLLGLPVQPRGITLGATPSAIQLSIPTAAACAAADEGDPTAGVVGFVQSAATGEPAAEILVLARWVVVQRTGRNRRATANALSDANGRFLICGLPADTEVEIRADGGPSVTFGIGELPADGSVVKRDLLTR